MHKKVDKRHLGAETEQTQQTAYPMDLIKFAITAETHKIMQN